MAQPPRVHDGSRHHYPQGRVIGAARLRPRRPGGSDDASKAASSQPGKEYPERLVPWGAETILPRVSYRLKRKD